MLASEVNISLIFFFLSGVQTLKSLVHPEDPLEREVK